MRHFATVFLCVFGLASSVKSLDNDDVIPPIDGPEGPFDGAQRDSDWISWAGEFEGDMKLTQSQLRQLNVSSSERNGILGDRYRWADAKIPYVITGAFSSDEITKIETAFASYASNTCLRMVKRTTEADYVEIIRDGGCWSYVGRQGGKQQLSLVVGCVSQATIIHEFMHASGFFHEQSRTDRDTYVRIALENVQDDREGNFASYSASQITAFGEPYDYQSVMHYGAYDFSKNGQKTIVRLDGSNAALGNEVGFSQIDINKLNAMYQCTTATTATTAATTTAATTTAATTAPATTAVTTAGPTTTTGACTDSFSFCRRIRRFCDSYPEEMGTVCRKTCKICVSCEDKSRFEDRCPAWASAGYCTGQYEGFMTRNCKKSCGTC